MKKEKKLTNLRKNLKFLKKQIQKKSIKLLFVTLIFSSCGGLPKKPSIDLGIHDAPRSAVYFSNNQTGNEYDLDIEDTDKYLMFSPDHYQLLLIYIRKLESRLSPKRKTLKKEIKKFIKMSEKVMSKSFKRNYR